MKEPNNKSLESLLLTVSELRLPYWAKTTIALSAGVTPLLQALIPYVILAIIVKLLGF